MNLTIWQRGWSGSPSASTVTRTNILPWQESSVLLGHICWGRDGPPGILASLRAIGSWDAACTIQLGSPQAAPGFYPFSGLERQWYSCGVFGSQTRVAALRACWSIPPSPPFWDIQG